MRNKTQPARGERAAAPRAGHAYRRQTGGLRAANSFVFLVTLAVMALCVCVGSVSLPLKETLTVIWNAVFACRCRKASRRRSFSRCACRAALRCAHWRGALALRRGDAGAAQKSACGRQHARRCQRRVAGSCNRHRVWHYAAEVSVCGHDGSAILFAFLSLLVILSLAYKIDYSMSTNTIILIA